jgi:hypothetical protein
MKLVPRLIVLGFFFVLAGWGGWFYFGQTLRLTQVVGQQTAPLAMLAVNLMDFDTGLTRYDVSVLEGKANYWRLRIRQIELMTDSQQQQASAILFKEICSEPAALKLIQKVLPLGNDVTVQLLKSL